MMAWVFDTLFTSGQAFDFAFGSGGSVSDDPQNFGFRFPVSCSLPDHIPLEVHFEMSALMSPEISRRLRRWDWGRLFF